MGMFKFATLLLAVFSQLQSQVQADYGPYTQSPDYDSGAFGSWPTESYRSSAVIGPSLNVRQSSDFCSDGYTFLAPTGRVVRTPGPMIIDSEGHLVWTKQYGRTGAVDVHSFRGEVYLTFCVGRNYVAGYGDAGRCYLLNSSYEETYKFHGANDLVIDLREFHITRDDTAVVTVSDITPADLESVYGPGEGEGYILDGTFQELDIETGELLFQWKASQHFDFTDSYAAVDDGGTEEKPWDFFHITGVDKDGKGNFLVSSDAMNALVYIDGRTGDVLWQLGGKDSMYTQELTDDEVTLFSGPSHARFIDTDTDSETETEITLFDRAVDTPKATSRGISLILNHEDKTARTNTAYLNPSSITTPLSGGSIQHLSNSTSASASNSNILVSYGTTAAWTEYTSDGTPICEVHFGSESAFNDESIYSQRVTKHSWTGQPSTKPALALNGYEAAVSWNGATEVVSWVLEGSNSIAGGRDHHDKGKTKSTTKDAQKAMEDENEDDKAFTLLTAQPKSGFETILPIPSTNTYHFLRILAIDETGTILSKSTPLAWNPTTEQMAAVGANRVPAWQVFVYFLVGFLSAVAVGVVIWVVRRRISRRGVLLESRDRDADLDLDEDEDEDGQVDEEEEEERLREEDEEFERKRAMWKVKVKDGEEDFMGDENLSEDEVGLLKEM